MQVPIGGIAPADFGRGIFLSGSTVWFLPPFSLESQIDE
jgi:hypothetical protein